MIYIKIYGKGRDKTHIYTKADCKGDQIGPQVTALIVTTCQIAREAMAGLDKDEFLQMMGAAWDAESERRESET